MDDKCLNDLKCTVCNKLLGKGILTDAASRVEVKCRKCGKIQVFTGADTESVIEQSNHGVE